MSSRLSPEPPSRPPFGRVSSWWLPGWPAAAPKMGGHISHPRGQRALPPDALAWARGLRWFYRVSFLSSTSRWWFHSWSLGEDGREWSSHTWSHRGPGAAPVPVSPKRASRHVRSQASGLRRTHYWGGLCTCHGVNLWGCRGFAGFGLRLPCALNTGLVPLNQPSALRVGAHGAWLGADGVPQTSSPAGKSRKSQVPCPVNQVTHLPQDSFPVIGVMRASTLMGWAARPGELKAPY